MAASRPDPVSIPTLTRARRLAGWAALLAAILLPLGIVATASSFRAQSGNPEWR